MSFGTIIRCNSVLIPIQQGYIYTVCCKIVGNKVFKYQISGSEKYQNEFPTPKYVGVDTLIINME